RCWFGSRRMNASASSLESILQVLESRREARWKRHRKAVELKLRWRALAVKNFFQLVPGETILELGAGSGLLTAQLTCVARSENPITPVVFSPDLLEQAKNRDIPNATFLSAGDF